MPSSPGAGNTPGNIPSSTKSNGNIAGKIAETEGLMKSAKASKVKAQNAAKKAKADSDSRYAQASAQNAGGLAGVASGGGMMKGGAITAAIGADMMYGAGMVAAPISGIMMTIGKTLVASGAAAIAGGIMMKANGNNEIDQAAGKFAKAAEDGVISKKQSKIATVESKRANMLEMKINIKKSMMEALRAEPENAGKSDEEMEALIAQENQKFDKGFERGANALKNGGIMTIEGQEGGADRFFTMDADNPGQFMEIGILTNEDGTPLLGEDGELQAGEDIGLLDQEANPELFEEVRFGFQMVDEIKLMLEGDPENGIPPLARLELNEEGELVKGTYDVTNLGEMSELAGIVDLLDEEPAPLRFFTETVDGEEVQFFQEWDWDKNEAIGEKVSVDDMTGGDYDKNDPASLEAATTLAQDSLAKLGLTEGGDRYELLSPLVQDAFESDAKGLRIDLADVDLTSLRGGDRFGSVRDQALGGSARGEGGPRRPSEITAGIDMNAGTSRGSGSSFGSISDIFHGNKDQTQFI